MKTKELSIILLIALMFINISGIYGADEMIRNGSFEELANGTLPVNWRNQSWIPDTSVTQFGSDKEKFHSGSYSVLIQNGIENHGYFIQTVNVKENAFYKISGWIKTENVGQNAEGAGISLIDYFDVGGNFKGTHDWQYAELYVSTGPGIKSIDVMLQIGNYGSLNTGKAWFDDISMTKVNTIPPNAAIAAVKNKKDSPGPVTEEEIKKDPAQQKKNSGVLFFFLIAAIIVFLAGAAVVVLIIVMRKKSGKGGKTPENDGEAFPETEEKE